MSETMTTTAANPVPLRALARKQLAWREHFKKATPAEQDAEIECGARGLALAKSEIGQAAVRIGEKLNALIAEMRDFVEAWPDDEAAVAAALAAIAGAELRDMPQSASQYGSGFFSYVPGELATWLPVLEIMSERLEECDPLETAESLDEWNSQWGR